MRIYYETKDGYFEEVQKLTDIPHDAIGSYTVDHGIIVMTMGSCDQYHGMTEGQMIAIRSE